jgi:hypothetical protein
MPARSPRSPLAVLITLVAASMTAACAVEVTTGEPDKAPAPAQTTPPENKTPEDTTPSGDPKEEVNYVACLSELATGGNVDQVFSFYAKVRQSADGLSIDLQPLAAEANAPPASVSTAGVVGAPAQASSALTNGKFALTLGTLTIPATANPITSADVVIEAATLSGTLSCATLGGNITAPTDVARTLGPSNKCRFFPVKDGAPRPALTASNFTCTS